MVRFVDPAMATWVVENLNGNIPQGLSEPIVARYANTKQGAPAAKGAPGKDWYGGAAAGWQDSGKGAPAWQAGKGGAALGKGKKGAVGGSVQALFQSVKGA